MQRKLSTLKTPRPKVELALFLTLVGIDLWLLTERPGLSLLCRCAAVAILAAFWWRRKASAPAARPIVGSGRAWWEAGIATVGVATVLLAWMHFVRLPGELDWSVFRLPPLLMATWVVRRLFLAALQQGALQLFVRPVCGEIVSHDRAATLLGGLLFGLFHLPSATLAASTFVAAIVWQRLHRRSRRLLPLIASHAALAALATAVVPEHVFFGLEVGGRAVPAARHHRFLGQPEIRSLLRSLTSDEFASYHGGTREGLIRGLYRDVIGRVATPAEVQGWLTRLNGQSVLSVAKEMLLAAEIEGRRSALRSRSIDLEPLGGELAFARLAGPDGANPSAALAVWSRSLDFEPQPGRVYLAELDLRVSAAVGLQAALDSHALGKISCRPAEPCLRRLALSPLALSSSGRELTLVETAAPLSSTGGSGAIDVLSLRLAPLRYPPAAVLHVDDDHFLSGFSVAEQSMRWTQESKARLVYPLSEVDHSARYTLRLRAGAHDRQAIDVRINELPVASWVLEGLVPQIRSIVLEGTELEAGANVISFELPDARTASGDPRLLGIAFVSLSIESQSR